MSRSAGELPVPRRAPIRRPKATGPRVSPFTRLARVQAVSAAGDGCLALALAVSVFVGSVRYGIGRLGTIEP